MVKCSVCGAPAVVVPMPISYLSATCSAVMPGVSYSNLVDAPSCGKHSPAEIDQLRYEVEWRRAQEAKAQEQIERLLFRNSELRDIVRVVAQADNSDMSVCYQLCSYDMHWTDGEQGEHQVTTHNAPCVVEQARAALGMTGDRDAATTGEQSSDPGDAS